MKAVADNLYVVPAGGVNVFLLDAPDGLTLVDAGVPGSEARVLAAVAALGRVASDVKHVLCTHAHPDHVGGLAAVVRATAARTYLHALDVPIAESGGPFRPMTPAPGVVRNVLFRLVVDLKTTVPPAKIDQTVADGELLPVAGGMRVVHCPGHCLGQVAYVWEPRSVCFVGDVFSNLFGPGDPLGYEDRAEGRRSERKLAALDFRVACFGHGRPITRDAAKRMRGA